MACRLGYQITCNINNNVISRGACIGNSRRLRSLSPAGLYGHTKEHNGNDKSVDAGLIYPRARSQPSPVITGKFNNNNFQVSRKFSQSYSEEIDEAETSVPSTDDSAKLIPKKNMKIYKDRKGPITYKLQPKNINPMATSQINFNRFTPHEELHRLRRVSVDKLKKQAHSKYYNAVQYIKNTEDESYRYQLEAAKPKTQVPGQINNAAYDVQKKIQSISYQIPQLQPKNIKPYGNMTNLPWRAPNVESVKPSRVVYPNQKSIIRSKSTSQSTSTMDRKDSEGDVNRIGPSSTQHRDYCTAQHQVQENKQNSEELEKCSSILTQYKKLNPDYTVKNVKLLPGSEEEKNFIENTEKLVVDFKGQQQSEDLQKCNALIQQHKELNSDYKLYNTKAKTEEGKPTFSQASNITVDYKQKLQPSESSKFKLFYSQHGGIQCKNASQINLDEKAQPAEQYQTRYTRESPRRKLKVKMGPKMKLQSSCFYDNSDKYTSINPEPNVKYIVPWPSYGDRVKNQLKKKDNPILKVPSFSSLLGNSSNHKTNENISDKSDLQSRTFATQSNAPSVPKFRNNNFDNVIDKYETQAKHFRPRSKLDTLGNYIGEAIDPIFSEKHVHGYDLSYSMDMLNKSNGVSQADQICLKKNFDRIKHPRVLPLSLIRLYSKTSFRDPLDTEGSVMVKLRRLPKIKIAEPPKICPVEKCEDNIRADGQIKVQPKKLPILKAPKCPKVPEPCMSEGQPLVRPKRRSNPTFERVCRPPLECPPRADDGLKILPKKLPKIIPGDCPEICPNEMYAPPLPRLVPKPVTEPICKKVCEGAECCPPRADAGLRVTKKQLPPLVAPDCPQVCDPDMQEGTPFPRLKKVHIPEPKCKRPCEGLECCPPRSDDLAGYTVQKKKLQVIIPCEKNEKKKLNRPYSTDSKYSMCCYAEKKVQPEIIDNSAKDSSITRWKKFFRSTVNEEDNIKPFNEDTEQKYLEPKIVKRHLVPRSEQELFHDELLKYGYTTFSNSTRKFNTSACLNERKKRIRFKRIERRRHYFEDVPQDINWKTRLECKKPCKEDAINLRMDNILKLKIERKKLPTIPCGLCKCVPPMEIKDTPCPLQRLKKRFNYGDEPRCFPFDCRKVKRADDNLEEQPKKLQTMPCSKCPCPEIKVGKDRTPKLRRLPKFGKEDIDWAKQLRCKKPCDTPRADALVNLYIKKSLPVLKASNCPPKEPHKPHIPRPLKRLPKCPKEDHVWKCDTETQCQKNQRIRADVLSGYEVKPRTLPTILICNKKPFSTLSSNFFCKPIQEYTNPLHVLSRNFRLLQPSISNEIFTHAHRFLSTSSHLLKSGGNKKDCKIKTKEKGVDCKCFKVAPCQAPKSISCKRPPVRLPCSKQNSPYPAFSECKDEDPYQFPTECPDKMKYLQPKWPIFNSFPMKAPPPYQGHIDPSREEECVAKKYKLKRDGITKTCDTFDDPDPKLNTKEIIAEAEAQNKDKPPPAETCKSKPPAEGECMPVDLTKCKVPEPEFKQKPEKKRPSMICSEVKNEKKSECPKPSCPKKASCEKAKDSCAELFQQNNMKEDFECETDQTPCEVEKKPCKASPPKQQCKASPPKQQCKASPPKQQCKASPPKQQCKASPPKQQCKASGSGSSSNPQVCSFGKERYTLGKRKSKMGASDDAKTKSAVVCKPGAKARINSPPAMKPVSLAPETAPECQPPKGILAQILDFFRPKPTSSLCEAEEKEINKQAKNALGSQLEICKKSTVTKAPKSKCKQAASASQLKASPPPPKRTCPPRSAGSAPPKKSACSPPPKKAACSTPPKRSSCSTPPKKPACPPPSKKPVCSPPPKQECKKVGQADPCSNVGKNNYEENECDAAPRKCKETKKSEPEIVCYEEIPEEKCEEITEKKCEETCEEKCEATEKKPDCGGQKPGKCRLPPQKDCPPLARTTCKPVVIYPPCKPVEAPYASFSECNKGFPKIPISECRESEKRARNQEVKSNYSMPDSDGGSKCGSKSYSTLAFQKRMFSCSSNRGKPIDPFALFNITEDSLKDMENNELAVRILLVVKEGMNMMDLGSNTNAKEMYYRIFKELEDLCEQELRKCENENESFDVISRSLYKKGNWLDYNDKRRRNYSTNKTFPDIEQTMMVDAIKTFCGSIFSVPEFSTKNYEESERIKTKELQNQLDEILDNYNAQ